MKNNILAINGGKKVINSQLKKYNSIGSEEVLAAKNVVEGGVLSQFLGCWDEDFYGGSKVKEFEEKCKEYFNVKHAITVNSWTSGLIAAVGAIGVEPGDEIIVTPWTMCASATAILHWHAIPIFADIDPDTFNIDPDSVIKNITPQTKAIMAVDIFGLSSDVDTLKNIAKEYNLKLILDTAQSPGALYNGKYAGTIGDIGGFSLNYHKHIHTGEGGIVVTNDDDLAERVQLIRNHAEAVVGDMGVKNLSNMVGYNFRLGEIESAIGIEQLKKLENLASSRQKAAQKLNIGLSELNGLTIPFVPEGLTHVYYIYALKVDPILLGVSRNKIVEALVAEGVEGLSAGYANIHLLPMYQEKIAFGSKGFPWNAEFTTRDVDYSKGICPVAEDLQDNKYIGYEMCLHDLTDEDINNIITAFKKVWNNLDELK